MPGSAILVTREGTRPLLVEVQALVDQSPLANPRRVALGLEQNRLSMLLAVDNGYQCALMVPTEILAEQHFRTITSLVDDPDDPEAPAAFIAPRASSSRSASPR